MRLGVADEGEAAVVRDVEPLVAVRGPRVGAFDAVHQVAEARSRRRPQAERPVDVDPGVRPSGTHELDGRAERVERTGVHVAGLEAHDERPVARRQGRLQGVEPHPSLLVGRHRRSRGHGPAPGTGAPSGSWRAPRPPRATSIAGEPASPSASTSQPRAASTRWRAAARQVTCAIWQPVVSPNEVPAGRPNRSSSQAPTTSSTTDADGPAGVDPGVLVPGAGQPVRGERGRQRPADHEPEVARPGDPDDTRLGVAREALDARRAVPRLRPGAVRRARPGARRGWPWRGPAAPPRVSRNEAASSAVRARRAAGSAAAPGGDGRLGCGAGRMGLLWLGCWLRSQHPVPRARPVERRRGTMDALRPREASMAPRTILVIGTLDTKGTELAYLRDLIVGRGHVPLVLDAGTGEPPWAPDVGAARVAAAGGGDLDALRAANDRAAALEVMCRGARAVALELHAEGRVDAVISIGGSGGTAIGTSAMRAMPVGLPKVMVSTMASGDVSPYVDITDITMMYSVTDVAGLNRRVAPDPGQRRRGRVRDGRAGDPGGRRPPAGQRDDVRSHHAVRHPRPRAARDRRATRCSCSTRPAAADARWRRSSKAGSWPGWPT